MKMNAGTANRGDDFFYFPQVLTNFSSASVAMSPDNIHAVLPQLVDRSSWMPESIGGLK